MPGDEHHAADREFIGDGDRLLGIASVVADLQHEFFPEHAAFRVDVGDRLVGAAPHLLADGGVRAGDRAGHRDLDVLGPRGSRAEHQQAGEKHTALKLHVFFFPSGSSDFSASLPAYST